jgi:hypothetical protein
LDRPHVTFLVHDVSDLDGSSQIEVVIACADDLVPEFRSAPKSIGFCSTVAHALALVQHLREKHGIQAAAFYSHDPEKTRVDPDLRSAEDRKAWWDNAPPGAVLICTSKAGHGLDNADCSFCVHFCLRPDSIFLLQEMGRAGRGLQPSRWVLCYHPCFLVFPAANLDWDDPEECAEMQLVIQLVNRRKCWRAALLAMIPDAFYCAPRCQNCDACVPGLAVRQPCEVVLADALVEPSAIELLDSIESTDTQEPGRAWFTSLCLKKSAKWRTGLTHAQANAIVTHLLAEGIVRMSKAEPREGCAFYQPTCRVDGAKASAFRTAKTELTVHCTTTSHCGAPSPRAAKVG